MIRNASSWIALALMWLPGVWVPSAAAQLSDQAIDDLDVLIDQGRYRIAGPITPRNLSSWRQHFLLQVRVDTQRGRVRFLRDDVLPKINRDEEEFLDALSRRLSNDPAAIQTRLEVYRLLKERYTRELADAQAELQRRLDALSTWRRVDGLRAAARSPRDPARLVP